MSAIAAVEEAQQEISPESSARVCVWQDLGRLDYRSAWDLQLQQVESLKREETEDRLFFV
jgi:hypothetical protein